MNDDSDDELLANLLASTNDDDFSSAPEPESSVQPKPTALKELDFNFLENVSSDTNNDNVNSQSQKSSKEDKKPDSYHDDNAHSSDDEDKKYFEKQQYSEYGREIKNLLKNKEEENKDSQSFRICFKKENSFSSPSNNINKVPNINSSLDSSSPTLSKSFKAVAPKSDKYSLQVQAGPDNSTKKDVYKDPIFGLKIVTPLVSSAELAEKMEGRKAVTVSNIKLHLTQLSADQSTGDWVIAGVLMSKSNTKTSQKGSQYCLWKISDLTGEMKCVVVFLFSNAYKQFWKIPTGSVVGILNPSVLETRDDRDLATLSVDNPLKIMILGTSRDLGKCKARKKNGDPCSTPVNLSTCEFCIYHVKQEYSKFSKRTELQSIAPKNFFGNPKEEKKSSLSSLSSQARHPGALPFTPVLAKRNEKLYKKDSERLAMLKGDGRLPEKSDFRTPVIKKKEVLTIESSPGQARKDMERLAKLREWSAANNIELPVIEEKNEFKLSLPVPKLGTGARNGIIDFSAPVTKEQINSAKKSAIEWAKKIGGIKKSNPNKVRPNKADSNEKGLKRRREEKEDEAIKEVKVKKEKLVKTRFQEMLEKKSAHSDLIEKREDEETEQYFKKLEVKERMEEKMLTTYQVDCKAVRCGICKYTAFSSSELCKKLQHPIKVIDAVKRFFKCGDCGNRTVSLDRIPTETCKRCASSKWVKTAMMDEKRTQLTSSKLCIRGGEEKFIGSTVTDASLNLLVPETD